MLGQEGLALGIGNCRRQVLEEVAQIAVRLQAVGLGKRRKRPFLRRLSFLSWFIPQEDDHGSISGSGMFREGGVLV